MQTSENYTLPPSTEVGLGALPYVVIKIEGLSENSMPISSGTGFFYVLNSSPKFKKNIPVIVTNKHVIANQKKLSFHFAKRTEDGKRILDRSHIITIDALNYPIAYHNDDKVDLAAIPVVPMLREAEDAGVKLFYDFLTQKHCAPNWMTKHLQPATELLMIGFPNGLMDDVNNLPVTRKGSLATTYSADYNGESQFVADIASFPGSSGSPVFAHFPNYRPTEDGNLMLGETAVYFVGVLFAGPIFSVDGTIEQRPIPTSTLVARSQLMMHLGFCIKSNRVEELASCFSVRE